MLLWVQVIIAIAALVYIVEHALKYLNHVIDKVIQRHLDALTQLHRTTFEAIDVSFDLWWEDGHRATVLSKLQEKTKEQVRKQLPADMPFDVPDEVIDSMATYQGESILVQLRESALHLAVHACMREKETELFQRLTKFRGFRKGVLQDREDHEEELNLERHTLMDFGINPTELEAHFTTRM